MIIGKRKMNKKGVLPLIAIVGLVAVAIMIFAGGTIAFKLSSIPAFVWIILAVVILFKIASGGKKK